MNSTVCFTLTAMMLTANKPLRFQRNISCQFKLVDAYTQDSFILRSMPFLHTLQRWSNTNRANSQWLHIYASPTKLVYNVCAKAHNCWNYREMSQQNGILTRIHISHGNNNIKYTMVNYMVEFERRERERKKWMYVKWNN